jgi:DNA processing protein
MLNLKVNTNTSIFTEQPIDVFREMAAYEALWSQSTASFKSLAAIFRENPNAVPSEFFKDNELDDVAAELAKRLTNAKNKNYNACLFRTADYPTKLRDAEHPIEFFYYRGELDLAFSPKSVAVVGTRSPSEDGIRRTRKLVAHLVRDGITIFSGLAKGVDTQAHKTAIEYGGRTVAVIGTPITEVYPKENANLQEEIASKHLLISQVPILRYEKQTYIGNRFFFPERNITMSALTDATIIVEASETSGTLIQARAALKQNRKLFILDSCFENRNITWPAKFAERGAIRVKSFEDIIERL